MGRDVLEVGSESRGHRYVCINLETQNQVCRQNSEKLAWRCVCLLKSGWVSQNEAAVRPLFGHYIYSCRGIYYDNHKLNDWPGS